MAGLRSPVNPALDPTPHAKAPMTRFRDLLRDLGLLLAAILGTVALIGADWGQLLALFLAGMAVTILILKRHLGLKALPAPAAEKVGAIGQKLSPLTSETAGALRPVLDALPNPVLLLDAGRVVRLANRSAREYFGADIEGRSLLTHLRQPTLVAAIADRLAGKTIEPVELSEIRGHVFLAHVATIANDSVAASIGECLIHCEDISALRRAETLRGDFIANVSHELKTPISTLIGFLETLKGPAAADRAAQTKFIAIMLTEAQRMSRLVGDLLSLSRIELNEHQAPTGMVDLAKLVDILVESQALAAAKRGISIEKPLHWDRSIIPGDSDELAQLFQNLLDNAVKYSRDGAVISIRAEVTGGPARLHRHLPLQPNTGAMLSVGILDQGEGIAREHLPRLTERFYRIDSARSRELGGTGLGLAIVKHIINRHRGSLEINSTLGTGSIFTVHLPLGPNHES
jgi:two-component system, OmpR family, phosphate regulon sensor histidine kinase PhoR